MENELRLHGHEEAAKRLESLGAEVSCQFLSQSVTELFTNLRRLLGLPPAFISVPRLIKDTSNLQNQASSPSSN